MASEAGEVMGFPRWIRRDPEADVLRGITVAAIASRLGLAIKNPDGLSGSCDSSFESLDRDKPCGGVEGTSRPLADA